MLCICHTTPTQNGPLQYLVRLGRLLGPKMALGILSYVTRYCIESRAMVLQV